jgi:hypothetical protein
MRCLLFGWLSFSGTFDFGCLYISFLALPGFLVYELGFSGCFLLLVTSHAVLIAAILCDALSCSGVFGFGCLSFPFRLYKLFWPVIRLIFWLFSASHYMGCCAPHGCNSMRCFLLCDGDLVLACSISFVFSFPFRLHKVFSSGVFMRVFMSL